MDPEEFDQIWDETLWEKHINRIEVESTRLRNFITQTWGDTQPSWERLLSEYATKAEAVDAFVEEELQYEEVFFPDDDDFEEDEDDELDDELFLADEDEQEPDPDDDESFELMSQSFEDLESGAELIYDDDFEVYESARAFSAEVLSWREQLGEVDDQELVNGFVTQCMLISTKLAAAYSYGFEPEFLGANIVYCRKSLELANAALERWKEIGESPLVEKPHYFILAEKLMELRNELGIYIQELREEFEQDSDFYP